MSTPRRSAHRPTLREGIEKIIREKLNIPPEDTVVFHTPQFERKARDPAPGVLVPDAAVFASLATAPIPVLRELGLRAFGSIPEGEDGNDKPGAPILYLFPGEWYAHIPAGFEVVDIMGNRERFEPGVSDDDIRFGCLPYGVLRTE